MSTETGSKATISCLCGSIRQTVTLSPVDTDIVFCHCTACRHMSGQLFTSYVALSSAPTSLVSLKKYNSGPDHPNLETTCYYFCSTCGCHVFQRSSYYSDSDASNDDSNDKEQFEWSVATGVITSSENDNPNHRIQWQHQKADDTKDLGLSLWLPSASNSTSTSTSNIGQKATKIPDIITVPNTRNTKDLNNIFPAACHCKRISFHLTRPSQASILPHRGYPDAMYSYAAEPERLTSNPHDEKWWLRGPEPQCTSSTSSRTPPLGVESITSFTRYFTGACVCKSCRLASGFEIQCWAFVPRCNIQFASVVEGTLDFDALPPGLLKRYESSPGVWREFCPTCGATVFYHAEKAKDVIDVSVGLFDGDRGARAEDWLEWGRERVSYAEEVREGRKDGMADWAERLLKGLEEGMKGS
ncbi:hypothetical protein SMACR_06832 [Sordaria macrospora]|uniref:WGS project CABT00000000 data, contig 2.6 n=2 Tax=Sordaria macrospora TaxID=5147 RepID=F7VSM9_SORMK|nr:uncharacterized protein SMAC_06832 [Sordaria macrospora k-hell]KAA8630185.1 hypothetical protein SMACR_06832 [Sordaria macrospora]WPJ57675.1 hypothetical protein SMAC4_06832 [Sordaria macrospora]CCC08696.1 unnamed protein product [Sordaria macrospora k-hell]